MSSRLPFSKDTFGHHEVQVHDLDGAAHLLPASTRPEQSLASSPLDDIDQFLWKDLYVGKLNRIHSSLWIAGRAIPPRPLNFYLASSNKIILDERIDMHLVWEDPAILHLKPLPRYLLDAEFWETKLVPGRPSDDPTASGAPPSRPRELYRCATGFLASYVALIQYESDLAIAHRHDLLPRGVTWPQWLAFVSQLLCSQTTHPANINPRYLYGELQLSRLNNVCGLMGRGAYQLTHKTYYEFFKAQMYPATAAIIYVVLVLTAMQVGLGTTWLGQNSTFNVWSAGFTIWSIVAPLIVFVLAVMFFVLRLSVSLGGSRRVAMEQAARFEVEDPIHPDRF